MKNFKVEDLIKINKINILIKKRNFIIHFLLHRLDLKVF